jgi:glycosyltransferase involved in cell wall biosynthesis
VPVKEYGIYVAYPPTVDLRVEGLGRYLAAFLKGAEGRTDVRFTIVCPSWSHDSLEQLFLSENVPMNRVRVIGPKGKPYALYVYEAWKSYLKRERGSSWLRRLSRGMDKVATRAQMRLERRGITVNSLSTLLMFCVEALPVGALLLMLAPLWIPMLLINRWKPLLQRGFQRLAPRIAAKRAQLKALLDEPQGIGLVQRLFADMEQSESLRMQKVIDRLHEVTAWYCPTAFWPAFNEIKAPRLMCVPDVVLTDFPVGFSSVNGNYTLQVFEKVQESIHSAHNLVTYSDAVKWGTLVDRYGVDAEKISVIHHAANKLNRAVEITGFPDTEKTAKHHCQKLLFQALLRATNIDYTSGLVNGELQFIFYASQFRPNKNIITLLRAYEYLLRNRYISHKLILTGHPRSAPEIQDFISINRLENDVLCLPKLSIAELAACYKLAALAVNPSLSEGGCPFTFTEALSVDTPVVMARIPVTEEVLTDPQLQEISFFDPYDWQDCARRIEWGLAHPQELLARQRITYDQLSQRSWSDVVNEHIEVLDRISRVDRIKNPQ